MHQPALLFRTRLFSQQLRSISSSQPTLDSVIRSFCNSHSFQGASDSSLTTLSAPARSTWDDGISYVVRPAVGGVTEIKTSPGSRWRGSEGSGEEGKLNCFHGEEIRFFTVQYTVCSPITGISTFGSFGVAKFGRARDPSIFRAKAGASASIKTRISPRGFLQPPRRGQPRHVTQRIRKQESETRKDDCSSK